MKVRGYFALVESGAVDVPRAAVLARMTAAEHAGLRAAGLLRPGPDRAAWPCDRELDCARKVTGSARGSATPFVGVCERAAGGGDLCPDVDLTADDLAQEHLALADLGRALQRLYGLAEGDLSAALRSSRAEPLLLGARSDRERARDVFLALAPGDPAFPAFLDLREQAARASLVLVPTARRVTAGLAARHGPDARVEIEVLEDTLALADGALAFAPRLRLVVPPR